MTAERLDGEAIAQLVRAEVREHAAALRARGTYPGLAVVIAGDNPASLSYVRGKSRAATEAGIASETIRLPGDVTQADLLGLLADLNGDNRFHGLLVQQPLPETIDAGAVIRGVSPAKDVDGLHPLNAGLLLHGKPLFVPCTPLAVQELLVRSGHDPTGRRVVILGRSTLVGRPLATLLLQKARGADATVTVCHSATRDLAAITREAEILVAAIGRPHFVTAEMVAPGAVVIDVGINRVSDANRKRGYRLVGDVDAEQVAAKAAALTPVPGGVGPMTVAMLLANTVKAAELDARGAPAPATGLDRGAAAARTS